MNTNKKAVSAATEHGKETCIHTNPSYLVYTKERNLSNDIRGGDNDAVLLNIFYLRS